MSPHLHTITQNVTNHHPDQVRHALEQLPMDSVTLGALSALCSALSSRPDQKPLFSQLWKHILPHTTPDRVVRVLSHHPLNECSELLDQALPFFSAQSLMNVMVDPYPSVDLSDEEVMVLADSLAPHLTHAERVQLAQAIAPPPPPQSQVLHALIALHEVDNPNPNSPKLTKKI